MKSKRNVPILILLAVLCPWTVAGESAPSDYHAGEEQLRRLIAALLEGNPEILAAGARSRAVAERIPQARALPDPMVSYRQFLRTPETRVGPQEQALEISQGLPWRGKRGLQARQAEHAASGVRWEERGLERALVAELKRSYYEAAYLQEALVVNREERELLRRFEEISLTRYATGEGIQQSVIKVQTELTRLDDQQAALSERLRIAVRRIGRLIGAPAEPLVLGPISLEIVPLDYRLDTLEQTAIDNHPAIEAARSRIEAGKSLSARRRMDGKPDFKVGLGYTMVGSREDAAGVLMPPADNGKDIVAVNVGINIPLYRKRIRAGIAEAEAGVESDERRLAQQQDRLRYLVQEATLRIESLEERARLHAEVLIPQAEESLASAEAAYSTDRQEFLELLDAERILFQVRLNYHRLVSDYWGALSDLEFAIGQRFPRQVNP